MLAKAQRISKPREISKILKYGRRTEGGLVSIIVLTAKSSVSRFGALISAKTFKKSTQRNLLKRRVFEAFRALLPNIKPASDLLIKIKKEATQDDFKLDIEQCLKKARLI